MILPSLKTGYSRFGRGLIENVVITATGSQTYTIKAGTTHVAVELYGGGGGGGGGAGTKKGDVWGGGGGGSGAYTYTVLTENFVKDYFLTLEIGAGGAGGTYNEVGFEGGSTILLRYRDSNNNSITIFGVEAGGGAGGDTQYEGFTYGFGGLTSGGISPSVDGNDGVSYSAFPPERGTECKEGNFGGQNVGCDVCIVPAGGNCVLSPNGASSVDGAGGGGGSGSISGALQGSGGAGGNGFIRINAYSYYPPAPVYGII
jgi:hypothetical protein